MDVKSILLNNSERIISIARYFAAALVPLVLNLITNPIVASNMSPEDYAIVGYYRSYSSFVIPLVLFSVLNYYIKRFYEVQDSEHDKLKAHIFKFLIFASILLGFLAVIGIYVYTLIFNSDSQIPLFPYVWIAIMALPLNGVYALLLVDYKMERRSRIYVIVSIIFAVIKVWLLILFVVVLKWGAFGNLLSILIANGVFFLICCYLYRALFKIKVTLDGYRPIIRFCLPLAASAMLVFFTNGYDRVCLEKLGEINELGFYVVAFSICSYLHMFSDAVGNTFQPDIYKSLANRNLKQYFKFCAIVFFSEFMVVAMFVPLARPIANIITAGKYTESYHYMQILAWSTLASSLYYAASEFTAAMGLTKITLYNKIFTSLASVVMYKLLIDNYRFIGAALGVSVSYLISVIGNLSFLFFSRKKLKCIWLNPPQTQS